MNRDRFDELSRNPARTLTRRQALRSAGAVAAAATAFAPTRGRAQLDGDSACRYEIELHISAGPSAPLENSVTLELPISASGAIDGGTFEDANGVTAEVIGQATGSALDLLISSPSGLTITLSGVGSGPISGCNARIKGIITGPSPGDIGTWNTKGDAEVTVNPPTPQSVQPPAGGSSAQCTPIDCGESFVQDPISCLCVCSSSTIACGQNCCPSGSACDQATGTCGCPAGTEQCGTNCVSGCGPDQFLDFDSCTCMNSGGGGGSCLAVGQTCGGHNDCCEGYCAGGTCQICGFEVCGDWGCVDTSLDPHHCGGCYAQCFSPGVCINGFCQS